MESAGGYENMTQILWEIARSPEARDRQRVLQQCMGALFLSFNNVEALVYASDLRTHEILAANDYCERYFGPGLVGQLCYRKFYPEQERPCPFCTNPKLLTAEGMPAPPVRRESQDPTTGHWYQALDQAIPWPGRKWVRLNISFNITRQKEAERALKEALDEMERRVDERTATLSRTNERLTLEIRERQQAEANLRDSSERYQVLAESVADGVAVIQDGRIVFANRALLQMFGCGEEKALLGSRFGDLVARRCRRSCTESLLRLDGRDAAKTRFEATCRGAGNREIWIEANNSAVQWKGRQAVLSAVRDITESKGRELAILREARVLQEENRRLKSSMEDRTRFGEIVGRSRAMQRVYEFIRKAAETDVSILVSGESGTGKELVAREIHALSRHRSHHFVAVNCGAIPENLFESEFFGYKKGAFSGAFIDKPGYLDMADGGTLFLDEIGDLPLDMQVKLLRILDGKEYYPIGSHRPRTSDFRLIGATNRNLREMVRRGKVREDFFFRVHVLTLSLPPLRERTEDIPLLVAHCLKRQTRKEGKAPAAVPATVMDALLAHDWPGNVRELFSAIQRYVTMNRLDLGEKSPPVAEAEIPSPMRERPPEPADARLTHAVRAAERQTLLDALQAARWRRREAARALGINVKTLYLKIRQHGLL